MELRIKALSPKIGREIPAPFYATPGSAAMDLHACLDQAVTIPAGERVDAVISRVLARAEELNRPDPVQALGELGNGSTVVYCVWAVCRELAAGDAAALLASPTAAIADLAAESFRAVGAPGCGNAFAALLAQPREDAAALQAAEQALRQALETECPLSLCEEYIADHADEFIDETEQN